MNLVAISASKATFAYSTEKCEEGTIDFVVDRSSLWSAEGLAELFNKCRLAFLGDKSEDPTEPWESWHLVSVQEETGCFLIGTEDE